MTKDKRIQVNVDLRKDINDRLRSMSHAQGISIRKLCANIISEYVMHDAVYVDREMHRLASSLVALDAKKRMGKKELRDSVLETVREKLR